MSAPGIEMLRLFERVSTKTGKTYFSGRLGGLALVVFRDDRCEPRFNAVAEWSVYASEPRAAPAQPPRAAVAKKRKPEKRPAQADEPPPWDDELPPNMRPSETTP